MTSQQTNRDQHLWLALLVVGSVVLTLGFACATPFAAFAALAALTLPLPRNEALLAAGGVWFANQAAGFLFLHYPWTADCLAWGAALGIGMIVAALAAREASGRLDRMGTVAAGLGGFAAAFAAHQLFLFIVGVALLGGTEEFALPVVGQILTANVATFAGLVVLGWLADRIGLVRVSSLRPALGG